MSEEYIKRSDVFRMLQIYSRDEFEKRVEALPVANVVEVVRCKDCKFDGQYIWCQYFTVDNGYCPRGRRR